ncbi:MAG: S1C family serine protease [Deltaproteobacteria bacterium]|nr:S1C family serine protease [Deltaproteobacteria bacterium]
MSKRVVLVILVLFLVVPAAVRGQEFTAETLDAVVKVRAQVPSEARTARTLGPLREGSGAIIDSKGLVLTIGYLILEASQVQVTDSSGRTVPAKVLGYDHASGFGLLRALSAVGGARPLSLGLSESLDQGAEVLILSHAENGPSGQGAYVVSRREFAGYWEYLLDKAIFTAPHHANFGGAALIDRSGRLLGIGSLQVPEAIPGQPVPGNMFVPIDLLKPILSDLAQKGSSGARRRPWLGVQMEEVGRHVVVRRVSRGGPAARSGLEPGQLIAGVGGAPVAGLADLYRKVWALGTPGVSVPLNVLKGVRVEEVQVVSGDRYDYLRLKPTVMSR